MMQEQQHRGNIEMGRSTITKPAISFEEMLNAIRDSMSDLASSEDEEDWADKDDDEEDTGIGKLSEDDKPSWVMSTISKTVGHRMQCLLPQEFRLDKPMQPGQGDTADYFYVRAMMYAMSEFNVSAVGKAQTDTTAATPSPTTCGKIMQALDIVPRQLQMPQVTSPQGCTQMRLGSEKQ
jgi:hypothetical protein